MQAIKGETLIYYPPVFEASDPRPSHRRGYYFLGGQYLQLPPIGSGPPLVLPTSLSFTVWLRPQGAGALYHKDGVFMVSLDAGRQIVIEVGNPQTSFSHTSALALDVWTYLAVTLAFSSSTGLTSISVYLDGSQAGATFSAMTFLRDESLTAAQLIGAAAGPSQFYSGFIWKITISNFLSSIVTTDFAGFSQPLGLSFLLSPCPFLQTADCSPCSGCLEGCVRPTDCGLCTDPLCEACHDFSTCDQCISHASDLTHCQCLPEFLYSSITRTCDSCAPECKTCIGSSYLDCLSCNIPAHLKSGICACDEGYFPDPNAGHCTLCASSCKTCSSFSLCLSCNPNSYLIDINCVCNEGYSGTPPACDPCENGCFKCAAICLQCLPGYYYLTGNCYQHCPSKYQEVDNSCVLKPQPFTASLAVVGNKTLELSFSAQLSAELREIDFTLTAETVDSVTLNFTYFFTISEPLVKYQIHFNLNCSEVDFILYFPETSKLSDLNSNILETQELHQMLFLPCILSNDTTSPEANPVATSAAQGTILIGIISSLVSGSVGGLFSLINTLQLLSYLPLSTIPIPHRLKSLLAALNMQSFIPNPFLLWLGEEHSVPAFAASYGYDSTLFLANCGIMISVGVVLMVYWALTRLMAKLPLGFVRLYMQKAIRRNTFIIYWITVYLDVCLAALLQSIWLSFASFSEGFNACLGIFVALFALATPFRVLMISLTKELRTSEKWTVLFTEFKCESVRSSLFYSVFLLRRLLFSLVLITLSLWPKVQSTCFLAFSLTVFVT